MTAILVDPDDGGNDEEPTFSAIARPLRFRLRPGATGRTDQSVMCPHEYSAAARRTPLPQRHQPAALDGLLLPRPRQGARGARHRRPERRLFRRAFGGHGCRRSGHRHGGVLQLQPRPRRPASASRVVRRCPAGGAGRPAARRRHHPAAAAGRGGHRLPGAGRGGRAGAARRRGMHPTRPAALRRPRRSPGARGAASGVLARLPRCCGSTAATAISPRS